MVVTDLKHMAEQVKMTPEMQKALDFIKASEGKTLTDGTTQLDGDKVYAMVQTYDTLVHADPARLEAHKKYIDVQYVAEGEEVIGWAQVSAMKETVSYNAEKDYWLGTMAAKDMTPVVLKKGQAAILWPDDGHAPRLALGAPSHVVKIVVKVAV
jgi:biofilm protein TabA